jgi:hypothetical protein
VSANPSRKLARRLEQAAKDSKVVAAIPGAPGQPTPQHTDEAPPVKERERRITLTQEQAALLVAAQNRVASAQAEVELLLKMVLAREHILEGRVVSIQGGEPPTLLVMVPEPNGRRQKG